MLNALKVLFVNPEFPDTYWSFKHALPFEGKSCAFPPLGLLTVSALLPQNWERRLVDLNVTPELQTSDIDWADIVMVSGMLIQKEAIHRIINQAKARGKKVALGGPYISTSVEEMPDADYIFKGEVEDTLPEFLHDLEMKIPQRFYIADKKNLPSLDKTPVPDFSLINPSDYGSMSIQYSRGCPFNCEFCDIIEIYGRVPRSKSNEQVLTELDAIAATGYYGSVFIVDDNFIGNKKKVHALLPALQEWQDANNRPFTFITEASLNLADDEPLLAKMQAAGFYRVFLGIETPVIESLKETQKTQNTKRNMLQSVRRIMDYGMEVMAGFIVGFDQDPENIFELQTDFIQASGIPLAMVGMLTALPDTQLWHRLEKEGRLIQESSGSNAEYVNFVPKMGVERLVEGYHYILHKIFAPDAYYKRVLDFLSWTKNNPEPTSYGFRRAIRILARVIIKLGVMDKERKEFWRFLYQVWQEHRDRFPQAIRFAVMGYHFRQLVPKQIPELATTS